MFFSKDVYETFNILLRRKPKENNFKVGDACYLNSVIDDCVTNSVVGEKRNARLAQSRYLIKGRKGWEETLRSWRNSCSAVKIE